MAANNKGNNDGPTAFELAGTMLDMSQFVYRFYELRNIVRKHDPNVKDMKYGTQYAPEESSWWPWNKGLKQVKFAETALIIQDDSANKNHPDRNLVSVITPQAIEDFLEKEVDGKKNRRFFKEDKSGGINFDETESVENTDFHFLEDFDKYKEQNVQIIDYVSLSPSSWVPSLKR